MRHRAVAKRRMTASLCRKRTLVKGRYPLHASNRGRSRPEFFVMKALSHEIESKYAIPYDDISSQTLSPIYFRDRR